MIAGVSLSHYAAQPIGVLNPVQGHAHMRCVPYKPRGLWVSVDGEHDWPAWCDGEQFGVEGPQP